MLVSCLKPAYKNKVATNLNRCFRRSEVMKLHMRDRFVLLNILPPEGDIATIKIVHRLRQDLAPTEQEFKDYKITQNEGQVTWDDAMEQKRGAQEKKIGPKAFRLIEEAFEKLDKEKKLTEGHLSTYLLFAGDEKEDCDEEVKK